jgi:hypothetical protein
MYCCRSLPIHTRSAFKTVRDGQVRSQYPTRRSLHYEFQNNDMDAHWSLQKNPPQAPSIHRYLQIKPHNKIALGMNTRRGAAPIASV